MESITIWEKLKEIDTKMDLLLRKAYPDEFKEAEKKESTKTTKGRRVILE